MARKKGSKNKIKIHTVPEISAEYSLTLVTGDKEYKSTGSSIADAITNLPLDYTNIKLKGTFIISKGEKTLERFVYMKLLRMILANKLRRNGWCNMTEELFKAKE